MKSMKRGFELSALTTAVVALGAMVFAAGAPAQLPAESQAGFFTIGGTKALLATLTGEQEGSEGTYTVPGRNIEIRCKEAHIEEAKLLVAAEALVKLRHLGCEVVELSTGEVLEVCEIIPNKELLITAVVKPFLHGGSTYIQALPDGGTTFKIVKFKSGMGCPLPLSNPSTGSVAAQTKELEAVFQLGTFNQVVQELTNVKLMFGAFPAFLTGSAVVELTGSHKGLKLGVHQPHMPRLFA